MVSEVQWRPPFGTCSVLAWGDEYNELRPFCAMLMLCSAFWMYLLSWILLWKQDATWIQLVTWEMRWVCDKSGRSLWLWWMMVKIIVLSTPPLHHPPSPLPRYKATISFPFCSGIFEQEHLASLRNWDKISHLWDILYPRFKMRPPAKRASVWIRQKATGKWSTY